MAEQTLQPLLSVKDAARMVQLSPWTIRRHIRSGKLAAVNLASPGTHKPRWRIPPESLRAWVAASVYRPGASRT